MIDSKVRYDHLFHQTEEGNIGSHEKNIGMNDGIEQWFHVGMA